MIGSSAVGQFAGTQGSNIEVLKDANITNKLKFKKFYVEKKDICFNGFKF